MTTTTIKVDSDTRDLLKQQAEFRGRTLGQHLKALSEAEARRIRFEEMGKSMAANPPDESYFQELAEWASDAWN